MKSKHDQAVDYLFEEVGEFSQYGYDIYIGGFDAANRWISVDEELPPFERVLLKSETGYVETRTIKKHQICDNKLRITLSGHKIVSWRLIEIK